jgi:acetyl esterase/lipase
MSSEDILSQAPPAADVRIAYGRDPMQFVDLRVPINLALHPNHRATTTKVIPSEPEVASRERRRVEGSAFPPLAICLHGGFWRAKYDLAHAGHFCAALTHAGIATLNIEYRRVGNAGGAWPGSFEDVSSAFQAISAMAKKYRLDLSRTIVIGHSAGGQLALALAAQQLSIRGVVALAPVSDLRRAYDLHLSDDAVVEFVGGTPSEVPQRFAEASPFDLPVAVPQVILHGTRDDTVPIEMSRSYVEAKRNRGEDVRLIELDCGHFELIDPSSNAWPMVERAVFDLLKP